MREATDLQSREILFHIACEMGLHTCIAPLIENGVDPLCKVRDEARGLLVAAANGHDAVILELLDHGLAVETVWSCAVRNVLHEAIFAGHLQVIRLLIRHGIDLELWTGGGETALYVATSRNDKSIVRALLDAGAMVNGRTSDGSIPLHSAADQGAADMAEALIDAGAEINARSAARPTPLQLAARRNWVPGCDQVISVLIEAGADLDGQSEEMLRMKWLSMDEIELSTSSDHNGD